MIFKVEVELKNENIHVKFSCIDFQQILEIVNALIVYPYAHNEAECIRKLLYNNGEPLVRLFTCFTVWCIDIVSEKDIYFNQQCNV